MAATPAAAVEVLAHRLDDYFTRLAGRGFSAAVLVAQDGRVVLHRGYGSADDATATPVGPETVFDVGSLAKGFTAAAVVRLAETGRVGLHQPISRYLEGVPPDKAAITLHHLLTHTAGLRQDHAASHAAPLGRAAAERAILGQRLAFTPGTAFLYSNSGYTLAAAIVERLAGEPFADHLRRRLWSAAGLERTGFYGEARWRGQPVATAYWNGSDQGSPADWPAPSWALLGSGGILSTVGDLHRWYARLRAGGVLSPPATRRLFARHAVERAGLAYYGYGWSIETGKLGTVVAHSGTGRGGNSDLADYRDLGLVVVAASNRIVWRRLGRLPLTVRLPATEASRQLAANHAAGDFAPLPRPLLPAAVIAAAVAAPLAMLLVVFALRQRRRRRV